MLTRTAVERVERELVIRGARDTTRTSYLGSIRRYLDFASERRLPADETESVRKHLQYLLEERKLSGSTVNVAHTAVKLLFDAGFNKPWDVEPIPRYKRRPKLPVVLKRWEIRRLFEVPQNRRHLMVFKTIYSAGLRLGEARGIKISDIDSDQMKILIEDAKGGKSRYVMLSQVLLDELRDYWRAYRPRVWLFEGPSSGTPIHARTLQRSFKESVKKAGLPEATTLHALRHSFATHLLENGTPLPMIKSLLGHTSIKTTMIYLKVHQEATRVRSPLDGLPDISDPG